MYNRGYNKENLANKNKKIAVVVTYIGHFRSVWIRIVILNGNIIDWFSLFHITITRRSVCTVRIICTCTITTISTWIKIIIIITVVVIIIIIIIIVTIIIIIIIIVITRIVIWLIFVIVVFTVWWKIIWFSFLLVCCGYRSTIKCGWSFTICTGRREGCIDLHINMKQKLICRKMFYL